MAGMVQNMNNLLEILKNRLSGHEYFIANGGNKSYDICDDAGYNRAVKEEIEFLRDMLDYWCLRLNRAFINGWMGSQGISSWPDDDYYKELDRLFNLMQGK